MTSPLSFSIATSWASGCGLGKSIVTSPAFAGALSLVYSSPLEGAAKSTDEALPALPPSAFFSGWLSVAVLSPPVVESSELPQATRPSAASASTQRTASFFINGPFPLGLVGWRDCNPDTGRLGRGFSDP